jgi:hypothetical protein
MTAHPGTSRQFSDFGFNQDLRSEDTSLIVERTTNAPLRKSWRIGKEFDTNQKMQ